MNDIIKQIREEKLDINNQELFFSILIKGLLLDLKQNINIRNIPVPHIILGTGTDIMFLENKGLDISTDITIDNENYIYNIIPRCVVNPGAVDLIPDQLTNPYTRGLLLIENSNTILSLSAEMRRMPIKMGVSLKYYTDSYLDMLELILNLITKMSFIRTYNITYLGQIIKCSYKIPENFSEEHMMELDGLTQENKLRTLDMSLEIESNLPVYDNRTVISCDNIISKYKFNNSI